MTIKAKSQSKAKKEKSVFTCSKCDSQFPKWAGQCDECGAWNTLLESSKPKQSSNPRFSGYAGEISQNEVQFLSEVVAEKECRLATGASELDRVLGGGLVSGSVVLMGGDPGIGKSTLLTQTLAELSQTYQTLYVTGEESLAQVSMRAKRLGLPFEKMKCLSETAVDRILKAAYKEKPAVMVIDSIQTVFSEILNSAPGSVGQVRECAAQLVRFAKQNDCAVFLVGHVTKEGTLAGPRVLEHMVDTVLYFEGDSGSRFRIIRAVKNRFGAVNEIGVFAMGDNGLKEVSNPSAIFLSRHDDPVPGSLILVTREGSRPMLVEVQALVDESPLGNPRRVTLGLEQNRLSMLLAVLHRHTGVSMFNQDVYVNVVGGVRITETGADLAVLMAVLSSFRDRTLPNDLIAFGEVGLAGEIRPVPNGLERLKEASKHGFKTAIVPAANVPAKTKIKGMEIYRVSRLSEAIDYFQEQ
ncbi:DNA repair protein RadA [hydrothermal vent metagenome]|uniref:DNA repair protein RadA n=1 Tax=hydrothermal vent metagenome TaxID=652676 RepID=A0A3B0YGV2_9ZZZZ